MLSQSVADNIKVNAKDLYEMRLIFEPEAAYFAALRGTDAEIKRILDYGKTVLGVGCEFDI